MFQLLKHGSVLLLAPLRNHYLKVSIKMASKASSKPKVYLTRKINPESIKVLEEHCDVDSWTGTGPVPRADLLKNIPGKHALLCLLTDKVDKEVLAAGNDLKVIATMSVGFDHLDVKEIKSRKIRIGYTPGVLADATAELTLAVLLATSRRLFESNAAARDGEWAAWSPFWMCGHGLAGATVGIVGFGTIGQEVAMRIKPFKPKELLYYNRSPKPDIAKTIGAKQVPLDDLLKYSDFVIVTIAMAKETTKMFNDETFKKMKSTAIFVNTARGGVVDQAALVRALQNGTIGAAGLDVMDPEPIATDDPLLKLKNCVIVPHIGSATYTARNSMAMMSVENIIKGLNNEKMPAELI